MNDFLDQPIEIRGVCLDARVDAVVIQGANQDPEIDSFRVGKTFIDTAIGLIELCEADLATHRNVIDEFHLKCERMALDVAMKRNESDWVYHEYL